MADIDTVAYLHPGVCTEGAIAADFAINLKANKRRYVAPLRSRLPLASPQPQSPKSSDRSERAGTEVPEEQVNSLDYTACLRISLGDVPNGKRGLEAGWDPKADIVLPRFPGVSFRHFSLTFNDDYYLVVKDIGSTIGTSVIYGTQDGGPRINFEWTIGGHEFLQDKGPFVIKVTKEVQFQIVVQPFDRDAAAFRAKVDEFRAGRGTGDVDELLDGVVIRPPTQASSVAPKDGDFFLRRKIGQGSFANAYHMWDVRTRDEFVQKEPVDGLARVHIKKWKQEALLLRRVSHPHIVKLLGSDDGPRPTLRIEYVPGGSVSDHLKRREYFSGSECRHILKQATSAAAHLHGLEPRIIHRDISDNNILIEHRGPDGIVIKLSDLGASKEGVQHNTLVGTPSFWPPEFFGERVPETGRMVEAYTGAVDIWELGAVIAKLAGGQPQHTDRHAGDGTLWCKDIIHRARERHQMQHDDLDRLLLDGMLCMDPKSRWSAQRCHEESLRLAEGSRETWKTRAARPPAPSEDEDESGADHSEADVHPDSEGVTAGLSDLVPPGPGIDTTASVDGSPRYRRSDAPPPDSVARVQARARAEVQEVLDAIKEPENSLFLESDFGGASAFSEDRLRLTSSTEESSGGAVAGTRTTAPCRLETLAPQKRCREDEDDEMPARLKKFLDES